jgi:hypothetical protein
MLSQVVKCFVVVSDEGENAKHNGEYFHEVYHKYFHEVRLLLTRVAVLEYHMRGVAVWRGVIMADGCHWAFATAVCSPLARLSPSSVLWRRCTRHASYLCRSLTSTQRARWPKRAKM